MNAGCIVDGTTLTPYKCISFSSTRELASSISTFTVLHNAQPSRYVWNAKGEDILRKIQRAREAMASQSKENIFSETVH